MTSSAPAILFEYARTFILPLFSAGRIIYLHHSVEQAAHRYFVILMARRISVSGAEKLTCSLYDYPDLVICRYSKTAVFIDSRHVYRLLKRRKNSARASAYSHNRYEARRNSSKNRFFIFRLYVARI